ncbi:hypothetical protein AMATHDRAFT_83081 [Amanita thiersii Skay4041]|uniref:Uncharacterized protein n=1 Tax=Amanita thiersii Skay4041 TaxID=703135 RepID=A0A2A9P0Q1_9AGAR|nr:hypothetical protein AMATHDRAFT_83081 [Amanita thiersii Skay4041]
MSTIALALIPTRRTPPNEAALIFPDISFGHNSISALSPNNEDGGDDILILAGSTFAGAVRHEMKQGCHTQQGPFHSSRSAIYCSEELTEPSNDEGMFEVSSSTLPPLIFPVSDTMCRLHSKSANSSLPSTLVLPPDYNAGMRIFYLI